MYHLALCFIDGRVSRDAIGWASGVERLRLVMSEKERQCAHESAAVPVVLVTSVAEESDIETETEVATSIEGQGVRLAAFLRNNGPFSVQRWHSQSRRQHEKALGRTVHRQHDDGASGTRPAQSNRVALWVAIDRQAVETGLVSVVDVRQAQYARYNDVPLASLPTLLTDILKSA